MSVQYEHTIFRRPIQTENEKTARAEELDKLSADGFTIVTATVETGGVLSVVLKRQRLEAKK